MLSVKDAPCETIMRDFGASASHRLRLILQGSHREPEQALAQAMPLARRARELESRVHGNHWKAQALMQALHKIGMP